MSILIGILNALLIITSLFMICLVLIQRGKGGGLAGAFGGAGGSSAFGAKAADVFTKVTIGTAALWFALAVVLVILMNSGSRDTSGFESAASRDKALGTTSSKSKNAAGKDAGTSKDAAGLPSNTPPAKPEPDLPPALPGTSKGTAPAEAAPKDGPSKDAAPKAK